jgi:hypothetical protein
MGKMIEFVFERGGSFKAVLLEKDAPKTCEALLRLLPFTVEIRHGRFSGQEMYCQQEKMTVGKENNVPAGHGDIVFNPDPEWKAICINYGEKVREKTNWFNRFARIVPSDLSIALELGNRVWLQGAERVTLRLISD